MANIEHIESNELGLSVRGKINNVIDKTNSIDIDSLLNSIASKISSDALNTILANYYLKTQTYSRTEVNDIIAALHNFEPKVVASISEVTSSGYIYLILDENNTDPNNSYDEYLFINGKAEKVASFDTTIDLSNYVTSAQLTTALGNYVTSTIFNSAIEGVNSAGTRVSFVKEYKNGTLEYIGENGVILQDIFSKMLELKGLPTTVNEEKFYDITTEPIGNNIFLVIDNVVISSGVKVFSDLNNNHYRFEIVQQDADLLPQIKATCLIANDKDFTAKIKLSYIKYFGDIVTFDIQCSTTEEANNLQLSIPKLKFNKEAIISLTADDASASHYCALFNYINNRPYSLGYFFHHNQYDVGDLPKADTAHHDDAIFAPLGKTLGFTDGCGIERRITFDCAIWPHATSGENIMMDWIIEVDPSANNQYRFMTPFLVWGDLIPMLEFGCSISQHNVDTPKPETPEGILSGYIADNTKALTKLGRGFKILTRPDGNNTYIDASLNFPQHLTIVGESSPTIFQYPWAENFNMYKCLQQRRFPNALPDYITEVINSEMQKSKEERRWMHVGCHRAGQTSLDFVLWLNDNLGKEGSDVAWITTPDEFYEYWYMRKYAKIVKTVIGTTANFELYIPKGQYFYYPELTFMTNQNISAITNIHDKIKGFSFNGTNMFNINLDANLVSLAEKYTARFEANELPIDKQDALYFANQLRADLKTPFLLRIDAVENVPLESLSISGGNVTDLLIGETTQLTAVFTPAGTAQTNIEWSVNDIGIANVSSSGLVTCIGAGTAIITLSSIDNPAITTTQQIACVASRPITGITITGESNGIIDDEIQLTATLFPSNTTETGILWASNNNTIADVDERGIVTLKTVGDVIIKATSLNNTLIYDEFNITVASEIIPITEIELTIPNNSIEVGQTTQASVTLTPSNTTQAEVTYESLNLSIATINSSTGLITAVGIGTVTIRAKSTINNAIYGDKALNIIAAVIPITAITITGLTAVDNGSTLQLGVTYSPSNTTQQGVTWASSNNAIATVNSSGLVTAISEGNVVITATSTINGTISDTHNITINAISVVPITALMMTGVIDRRVGKNYQMPYTLTPADTTQIGLLWESSNPSVATIDSTGLVTPLSAGVTTLTLKSSSNSSITHTKRLEVFPSTTNPIYKLSGKSNNPGNILYYEDQGEYATPNNYKGLTSAGMSLVIRNAITGEDMTSLGFIKMTAAEKLSAFGSDGGATISAGSSNPLYLGGSNCYNEYAYGGEYNAADSIYIGQNVPNGTYNIKWLMASKDSKATSSTTLTINGTNIPITIANPQNNETYMDCGNIVVTDGKLKFAFTCDAKKYFGWNGIIIEKIA